MANKDGLLKTIQGELKKQPRLPCHAAALGYRLFALAITQGSPGDEEVEGIVDEFRAYVKTHQLEDLLNHQIRYAMRLTEGDLIFESMFQLFSLCDEIEALRQIGLEVDVQVYADFQSAVRERIQKQRKVANVAAGCLVEDWKRAWWWYEILAKKARK